MSTVTIEPYRCWGGPHDGESAQNIGANIHDYYYFMARGISQYVWPNFLYSFIHWLGKECGSERNIYAESFEEYITRLDIKFVQPGSFLPLEKLTEIGGAV